MTRTFCLISALVVTLSAAPAFADDGFTAIHMGNQKIGSAVAEFWTAHPAKPIAAATDGYMPVHMANQRVGSEVANLWLMQSGKQAFDLASR